jgi:hypothetical protein
MPPNQCIIISVFFDLFVFSFKKKI